MRNPHGLEQMNDDLAVGPGAKLVIAREAGAELFVVIDLTVADQRDPKRLVKQWLAPAFRIDNR